MGRVRSFIYLDVSVASVHGCGALVQDCRVYCALYPMEHPWAFLLCPLPCSKTTLLFLLCSAPSSSPTSSCLSWPAWVTVLPCLVSAWVTVLSCLGKEGCLQRGYEYRDRSSFLSGLEAPFHFEDELHTNRTPL